MIKNKKYFFVFAIVAIILVSLSCFLPDTIGESGKQGLSECPLSIEHFVVRGDSMSPFIVPNEEVSALFGYYDCNPIKREDVVLYDYPGNDNFLIKFVKAVPGDQWSLKEDGGRYIITVNGEILVNAEGEQYSLPESSARMIRLYTDDYPVIPADAYLLLGNRVDGSLDSTHFGLVGKDSIVAKVQF